jgi:hypothetical protein
MLLTKERKLSPISMRRMIFKKVIREYGGKRGKRRKYKMKKQILIKIYVQ